METEQGGKYILISPLPTFWFLTGVSTLVEVNWTSENRGTLSDSPYTSDSQNTEQDDKNEERTNGNYCTNWGLEGPYEKLIGMHSMGQILQDMVKRKCKVEGGSEQHTQRLLGIS